jgi:hypothetical protein
LTDDIDILKHPKFETRILNVHLTKLQYAALRNVSVRESMFQARKVTMSEVVREALATYVATHKKRSLRRTLSIKKEKL